MIGIIFFSSEISYKKSSSSDFSEITVCSDNGNWQVKQLHLGFPAVCCLHGIQVIGIPL